MRQQSVDGLLLGVGLFREQIARHRRRLFVRQVRHLRCDLRESPQAAGTGNGGMLVKGPQSRNHLLHLLPRIPIGSGRPLGSCGTGPSRKCVFLLRLRGHLGNQQLIEDRDARFPLAQRGGECRQPGQLHRFLQQFGVIRGSGGLGMQRRPRFQPQDIPAVLLRLRGRDAGRAESLSDAAGHVFKVAGSRLGPRMPHEFFRQ